MKIYINREILEIFEKIQAEGKTPDEWSEIESDDMFQTKNVVGGYDADEHAFCFSYYDRDRREYWFQLNLEEIGEILQGKVIDIEGRLAE